MKKIYCFTIALMLYALGANAQQEAFFHQKSFTFIHLSDIHVASQISLVNAFDTNGVEAGCYLNEFNRMWPRPSFLVASGDISNVGNSSSVPGGMYSVLRQYLYPANVTYPNPGDLFIDSAQTIPFYFAPGNHDYYTTLYPPGTWTQLNTLPNYAEYISPDTDYAIVTDIAVFLFIRSGNDVSYVISLDPLGSGLTDEQIAWTKIELEQNRSKRKIIIMHHPPSNYTGTDCEGNVHTVADSAGHSIYVNRTEFLDLCDANNVDVVLCGHTHENMVTDRAGNPISENCTNCGPRYVQTGPAFMGCYRSITVDSAFVSVSEPIVANCDTTIVWDTTSTSDSTHITSIKNYYEAIDFAAYPNPSAGLFTLNLGQSLPVDLKIYNDLGQCVKQQTGTFSTGEIDMQSQAEGIYFLQITVKLGEPATYNYRYPLIIRR